MSRESIMPAAPPLSIKRKLYRLSTRIQRKLVPELRYCQYVYEDVLEEHVSPETEWLDLGCGWHLLPQWRSREEAALVGRSRRIVGLDFDLPSLQKHRTVHRRVRGDISTLPFRDLSFDLVTSNMVLEHLRDPRALFQEVFRVLRPGGAFLFHTPSIYGLATALGRLVPESLKDTLIKLIDDRDEADTFEAYYRINSQAAIRRMAGRTGFVTRKIKMIVSTPRLRIAPPLMLAELLTIRLLMWDRMAPLRPNIIALLSKEGGAGTAGAGR
jgi:ubiquinone/menaquinone biosynthesis C-methylase UbiE